jgi:hypothetical protein
MFYQYPHHNRWQNSFLGPSLEDSARFTIRFSLLWISEQHFFFYRARLSALRPTPNMEDQVSVFMSSSDRLAQLYPQAPDSLFVVFYDSQGYGGGMLTRLHFIIWKCRRTSCKYIVAAVYLSLLTASLSLTFASTR